MLEISHLSKHFGRLQAVDDVSLHLEPGLTAILGANGSGKTTLLRMIANVLQPEGGSIALDGKEIHEDITGYLSRIGYMPQHIGMVPSFSVERFLEYMGAMKGLDPDDTKKRIDELLEKVHLRDKRKTKIKALSGGMKQRVGIAQALLSDPDLLILDEPAAGLDPSERMEFSRLLADLSREKIILLSTHIVSDVERNSRSVVFMRNGKILAHRSAPELMDELNGCVYECLVSDEEQRLLERDHLITAIKETGTGLEVRYIDPQGDSFVAMRAHPVIPNLNDVYLWYTNNAKKEGDQA